MSASPAQRGLPASTVGCSVLDVRDLCVSFHTERGLVCVVDHFTLSIGQCEFLGIVGESGSGKTLSCLSILGLVKSPDAVITGSARYKGQDLIGARAADLRKIRGREIAVILQDAMSAMTPVHTIGAQIVEQIRAHSSVSSHAALRQAVELLGEMGLPNPEQQFHRYPHQLSGGMRQRALIAMGVSCNPSLLMADEPTTALDVTIQAQILRLLEKLRSSFKSSVILITHDMGVIRECTDRVLVMYAGRVIESGRTSEVFADPAHPYTQGLINSIPSLWGPKPGRLPVIAGTPPLSWARPSGCAFRPRCSQHDSRCGEVPPVFRSGSREVACWLRQNRELDDRARQAEGAK